MLVTVDRSPAISRNGNNMSGDNCGHCDDRLSQNGKKQQVKAATTRVYTFTASEMWFRNYYVAYRCICIVSLVCIKINNEELFFNAFPFENSYYFIDRLVWMVLDVVRSTRNLSSASLQL